MSKRDVIIISVLVNAGLLAILFLTAVKTEPELNLSTPPIEAIAISEEKIPLQVPSEPPLDEVDHVLKEYLPEVPLETAQVTQDVVEPPQEEPLVASEVVSSKQTFVDVTVKRGDALEKIARSNQTTVEAIRKANNLTSDKLKIGQVLKVPVSTLPKKEKPAPKMEETTVATSEPVFYTIKNGDNPWKIAKQFQVKFEDLLKLNNLDEERAKNLKVGEKIRVK